MTLFYCHGMWGFHFKSVCKYIAACITKGFGAITEVKMSFAKGTDTTPYHHRAGLLEMLLITDWKVLFNSWSGAWRA